MDDAQTFQRPHLRLAPLARIAAERFTKQTLLLLQWSRYDHLSRVPFCVVALIVIIRKAVAEEPGEDAGTLRSSPTGPAPGVVMEETGESDYRVGHISVWSAALLDLGSLAWCARGPTRAT